MVCMLQSVRLCELPTSDLLGCGLASAARYKACEPVVSCCCRSMCLMLSVYCNKAVITKIMEFERV